MDEARQTAGRRGAVALDLAALSTWGDIGRMAGNDFESAVFGRHPPVRAAFEALAGTRPLVCRMTGSGSALFAVYRSTGDREDARMMLGRKHGTLTAVRRSPRARRGPEPVAIRFSGSRGGPSSNGRTADFGSVNGGSNPPGPT